MEKINVNDVAKVLREALMKGETHFVFVKNDGSLRVATGTLNTDLIPEKDIQFKRNEDDRVEYPDRTPYYDLEKGAWRTCKFDGVVEVEGREVGL